MCMVTTVCKNAFLLEDSNGNGILFPNLLSLLRYQSDVDCRAWTVSINLDQFQVDIERLIRGSVKVRYDSNRIPSEVKAVNPMTYHKLLGNHDPYMRISCAIRERY